MYRHFVRNSIGCCALRAYLLFPNIEMWNKNEIEETIVQLKSFQIQFAVT